MSFNVSYVANLGTAIETVNHEGTTVNGNGTFIENPGYNTACFQVFGNFDARIEFEGRVKGDIFRSIPVLDADGNKITNTKKQGLYWANVAGLSQIRARVTAYVSGEINVNSRMMVESLPLISSTTASNRNVELVRGVDVSVAAGDREIVRPDLITPVKDFAFVYVVVYADKEHDFVARLRHYIRGGTFGSLVGRTDALEVFNDSRGIGEFLEVKGEDIQVEISNRDDEPRRYDVYLYGVR